MDGIKGKTEREEGREGGGEIECEVLWRSFFFKNRGGKQECNSGQQRRRTRAKGKEKWKIIVSASKGLQENSWIWPGGLLNNVVPLKQDS